MNHSPKRIAIHQSTSILIGVAYRAIYKAVRQQLSDQQLSPAQFILLAALWEQDGQSGAELSAALGLDSASMTGLIDRAVNKGYIERRPDPSDRRINRIWLMPQGRALENDVSAAMAQFDEQLTTLIEGDANDFNRSLLQLGTVGGK